MSCLIERAMEALFDELGVEQLHSVSRENNKKLKERFNTAITLNFYLHEDEAIFKMRKDSFGTFEYYLGMEYAREFIIGKIEDEKDIIVIYDTGNSDRVIRLIEWLYEIEGINEEEEDEEN